MNVKKLIKKFEERKTIIGNFQGYAVWWEDVKEIFEQLDEPQPVKVQQCVADWIEVCKEHLTTSLYTAMNPNFMKENNQSFDFILWIKKTSNQELFARAWLDGYEVEKEKRYTVVIKTTKQPLYYNVLDKKIFFSLGGLATKFTRKELEEAGFGEVFNSPLFEVEEVE